MGVGHRRLLLWPRGLVALQGGDEVVLAVLGEGSAQHGWFVGGERLADTVWCRLPHEGEDRGCAGGDGRRGLPDEPVVDADVRELGGGRSGRGTDRHAEQRYKE